jgi:hypothetical protein
VQGVAESSAHPRLPVHSKMPGSTGITANPKIGRDIGKVNMAKIILILTGKTYIRYEGSLNNDRPAFNPIFIMS